MISPRTYYLVTLFSGIGGKTLGMLRSSSSAGSRFQSVGAFDIDAIACRDFERLTGAKCQQVDLGVITTTELAARCERPPDVVVMSPPCTGYSGCLAQGLSKTDRYQALNMLALRAVNLAIESWGPQHRPKLLLLENVVGMLSRGADILEQIKALLRHAGYEVDLRIHDCGEIGGLAQSRTRVLLVARLRDACPTHLMMPPKRKLLPMSSVLWRLPVPLPIPTAPKGTKKRDHEADWLLEHGGPLHRLPQLAPINWLRLAAIPAGRDWRWIPASIRLQDVADPRVGKRKTRQNGGFGINDSAEPAHAVLGERGVQNTWASVCDPRSECTRRDGAVGVSDPGKPYPTAVIGAMQIHNNPSSVADPRLHHEPRRGTFGVQDPAQPSATVRGAHSVRQAPAAVADGRGLFQPTHELVAGQLPTSKTAWVNGDFELVGRPIEINAKGRACWLIIRAPDGTVHRPQTRLELAVLQGFPPWHRVGDPTSMEIGADGGGWLELEGSDSLARKHIGNAMPVDTAQAFGNEALELLDLGTTWSFRLNSRDIWVQHAEAA